MKNKTKSIWAGALVSALLLGGTAVPASEAANVPKLKQKTITIEKGKTKTIQVKGKRIKSKKFTSTKKKIATVSKKGKVKGKKVGSCKIKVTVKYRKAKKSKKLYTKKLTCKVKVIKAEKKTPTPTRQPKLNVSAAFTSQVSNTSVQLLKKAAANDIKGGKNVLLSPESILTALAMATNGARGETQAELQMALCGTLSVDDFNKNLSAYNDFLVLSKDVKFHLANGIWIKNKKDEIQANNQFLKTNEAYYHSGAYLEPFDKTTIKKMNDWVKKNTDGMIPTIIDSIPQTARMYLMNALSFEGRWASQYSNSQVTTETFTTASGQKQSVSMLNSTEHSYLQDDKATGFMKYYEGYDYAFAAILPNKGITVDQYISEMTGESFTKMIRSKTSPRVITKIPEFSYDYDLELTEPLKAMGIQKAFATDADFGNMATTKDGILYIDGVTHKTHIDLDRNGTKAAAVTKVVAAGSAMPTEPPKEVYLDRPFIYAIVEAGTGLPIFMGVVNSVK